MDLYRLRFFGCVCVLLLLASPAMAQTVNLRAELKGSNEVPPLNLAGSGQVTATFDPATKKLSWKGSLSNLTAAPTIPPASMLAVANFPDPFNPSTEIRYELPQASRVDVLVFDVRGRLVAKLYHGQQPAGLQAITWQGTSDLGTRVPSGAYWVRVVTPLAVGLEKLTVVR